MSLARCYAVALVLAGGCSWVYDADDLRSARDGSSADADPDALHVASSQPSMVYEGEGSSFVPADEEDDLVRAIPIVLVGQNMTDETVFSIEGLGLDEEIADVVVSADGRLAAFELRVPIIEALENDDTSQTLNIRLVKGMDADAEEELHLLEVTGLDALMRADGETIDTDDIPGRFTHVVLSGEVMASGAKPLRIVATAGIQIDDALRADAGDFPTPGPGGCAGGAATESADCGDGSGEAGTGSGAGGGGGYGAAGIEGEGGGGGAGDATGQIYLVPLQPMSPDTKPPARGAGGGGGAGLGGAGGGSGGVIELSTPAVLRLGATAVVSAWGGDGDDALCATGGGGGGGSGGAILLRAGLLDATGARAEVPGGAGDGGAGCTGGNGGRGRIRIDHPGEPMIDADNAFIGPSPVIADLPVIVTEASLSVPVRGQASQSYRFHVNDAETPVNFETEPNGLGTAEVTLEPGHNRLCVQVAPAADLKYSESTNCVNVAYIPR